MPARAPDRAAPVAGRTSGPPAAIPAAVWRITAVVVVGAFMANLDTALVNIGLDTIGRDLGASLASTFWSSPLRTTQPPTSSSTRWKKGP
ncbi:hypothetical protein FDG2_3750 [Candidatus Protofrankia californiensis]|uniref:Uncharacterized protein n=1 Tax=Candidatus Protofrankia californiensis TaxID=1839754 RepID=A0A1C3P0T9_9ACTN|nr:hypothetical protein FDG2_3750 [Candidatus Protofrankia californiensis]